MFKFKETKSLIDSLEQHRKNIRESQKEFKKSISSKLTKKQKATVFNKRMKKCTNAYYKYLAKLESVCVIYLSEKYKDDTYFNSCVEGDVMVTKLNYIIKEKYPNIWYVKCELLGEIGINRMSPEITAKAIKDIFTNPTPEHQPTKVLNTGMTSNQFYAEFGTMILYVLGVELEKFYKHTVHVLKAGKGWDAKDKREIRYMIEIFKSCKGDRDYETDAEHRRWRRKVDRAIGLYRKHWYGLWN